MRFKFDGFFNTKTNGSCTPLPKIDKGSIQANGGGCFGERNIKITLPHVTLDDKKLSDGIAKEHTYTFNF
jgi:hypothetical protein